jgi:hypothetical protein
MKLNTAFVLKGLTAAMLVGFGTAQAAEIVVTPASGTWVSTGNSGGGSSAITGTAPRSGNGSVEMTGDRTRFIMGNNFDVNSNLGLLDQLTQLTFDWRIALASAQSNTTHPDYTPALRVHIWDNGERSELIWEGAYNGTYGNTTRDTWYSSATTDVFHRWVNGSGTTFASPGGPQVNMTVTDWAASAYYSGNAYISGFSVGVGSTPGSGYLAFADNVTIGLGGATTTYNFELAAAAVPEPGSLALIGLGLFGAAAARRKVRRAD